MGDSIPTDPRIELAKLFENQRCPSLALIIRQTDSIRVTDPVAYTEALKPYSDLLNSIEDSICALAQERDDFESRSKISEANFQTIAKERDSLKNIIIEQQRQSLEGQRRTGALSSSKGNYPRKRMSTDPPSKFDAKDGAYHRVQESYETWEAKIIGVFDRDLDYFDTPKLRIGYIADQCDGKAFQFISGHVTAFRGNPNDPNLKFHDWEAMLKFMRQQYVTTDSSQFAKDKLDLFSQGNRNYWSWKQELDELFVKAKKTRAHITTTRKPTPTHCPCPNAPLSLAAPTTVAAGISHQASEVVEVSEAATRFPTAGAATPPSRALEFTSLRPATCPPGTRTSTSCALPITRQVMPLARFSRTTRRPILTMPARRVTIRATTRTQSGYSQKINPCAKSLARVETL
ncbi:uncharacterized protein B0H64DRAFT_411610 [Chaetomium fimeti]|uniref:Retrotransposon gag domain-containing protein n=1 Tax=Chaetomium fimeti TaxID=1854472 RepID=A0AAE0LMH4_9PEZI|nr:hypothetical protein B0H64DRAFT_411610 [Chaetomium fimeti]